MFGRDSKLDSSKSFLKMDLPGKIPIDWSESIISSK